MRLFRAVCLALALAPAARAGEIWVSNEKDNTLSVIDTETLAVKQTLSVGLRPRGIVFSPDRTRLYICASDSDTVQILDPATGIVTGELPSGEDPEQFAISPDGRHLIVANEDDAIATILDTTTGEVAGEINVGVEPEGVAFHPDGKIAVVTSETTNMVHWIDLETAALFDNSLVDQRPRHAEFSDDGRQLWVSSEIGGSVIVFDTETRAPIATITFRIPGISPDTIQPVGIRLTRDGRHAFVALGPANHVAVVNAQTYEVEDYLLVGRRVWHMAMNDEQTQLFTTNGISGDVTVIDIDRMVPVKTIKVGRYPWGAAYRP